MSIERELLKKIVDYMWEGELVDEIKELLDKREPLSDEEIKILYDRHAFAMESDEYMWGFRDAEKAHGIMEKTDV